MKVKIEKLDRCCPLGHTVRYTRITGKGILIAKGYCYRCDIKIKMGTQP